MSSTMMSGFSLQRGFQKRPAIAHRAHDFATGLQNLLQRIRQHAMIISQQYPWTSHDSIPSSAGAVTCSTAIAVDSGISARISVPRMGSETIESLPSTSRSRSRIPTNPIPEPRSFTAGLNPLPVSEMRRLRLLPLAPSSTWALLASLCLTTLFNAFLGNSE